MKSILKIRSLLNRHLSHNKGYFLATRSLKPISRKFGFDRGTPIDRYWINKFIEENSQYIKGNVLEIGDSRYTKEFGKSVINSDVLDIDKKNKKANIIDDLRNLEQIKTNNYDCLVITHVLGLVDDIDTAIRECHRILKPGGVMLATSSCFSPSHAPEMSHWRFTLPGAKYLFSKHFNKSSVTAKSFGNVLAGQCFWVGMSQEELTKEELEYNDPDYPCIVGIKAIK